MTLQCANLSSCLECSIMLTVLERFTLTSLEQLVNQTPKPCTDLEASAALKVSHERLNLFQVQLV